MKKILVFCTILATVPYVSSSYTTPSSPQPRELLEKAKELADHARREEIANEINERNLENRTPKPNLPTTPKISFSGCLYQPQDVDIKKPPLISGGFRFLLNAYTPNPEKFEEDTLAFYRMKYPRALFMVDPEIVLITRGPEGEIFGSEGRHGGFSIWYAPPDALDYLCLPRGMLFA